MFLLQMGSMYQERKALFFIIESIIKSIYNYYRGGIVKREGLRVSLVVIIIGIAATVLPIISVLKDDTVPNELAPLTTLPGIFFLSVGIWMLNEENKAIKNDNKIQSSPVIIKTKFKEIREHYDRDTGSDYYIITSWVNPEDKKIYFFKSDNVVYDYTEAIKKNGITEFTVNYEAGNIKNYKVDTSILKEINYEQSE